MVTVPVLSSTTVSTSRVDSSTSRPLDQQPELRAPAGADHQRRRRGEAERAGAGDDQNSYRGGEGPLSPRLPWPARTPRVASEKSAITTGTNTARHAVREALNLRLASLGLAGPGGRSVRAPCRRRPWSRAPPYVRRRLRSSPASSEPGLTSTGTDSPVSMLMSMADEPSSTTPPWATFSPGRDDEAVPRLKAASTAMRRSAPLVVDHRHLLGAELKERPQRRARRAASRAPRRSAPLRTNVVITDAVSSVCWSASPVDHRVDGPQPCSEHPNGYERVHGRRAVLKVDPGRPVEGPAVPEHDRRRRAQALATPSCRTGARRPSRGAGREA